MRNLAGYPDLRNDPAYVAESRSILSVEYGRRYAKIVNSRRNDRSVYCFLDLENGDILKAASWQKPAPHARGSLDDSSGWNKAVTAYGGVYLR
jgi:hypothetical protein